ncbi:MAG: DUF3787 domain-containing protein [Defluviitaleaceae bacterium]|nr:DUF3787 domain-containing protein [Defluviitaleaceae bacterium]
MKPKKNNPIPTNQGLQQYSTGVNQKYDTPLFETLALADDSGGHDPSTKAGIASDQAVADAKKWVDENRL